MISSVYCVEVSGACNYDTVCQWCPMYNRPRSRKRGLMNDATVERALHWVGKLPRHGETLHLHNFGEPLLHPKFDEIALKFSKLSQVSFSTNGVLQDEKWADRLAKVPWQWISLSPWDPAAVQRAAKLLSERGIRIMAPPGVTHNWAGQAQDGPFVSLIRGCPYLSKQLCVIRWDGSLATCCISDRDEDTIGHVNSEPDDVYTRGYSLCETCHHARGAK